MHLRKGWLVWALTGLLCAACGPNKSDVPEPINPDTPVLEQPQPMPQSDMSNSSGLDISSDPPTEIMVNGKSVGTSPITVDKLAAGTYEVTFVREGDSTTMVVELGEGEYKRVHHSPSPNASDARVGE